MGRESRDERPDWRQPVSIEGVGTDSQASVSGGLGRLGDKSAAAALLDVANPPKPDPLPLPKAAAAPAAPAAAAAVARAADASCPWAADAAPARLPRDDITSVRQHAAEALGGSVVPPARRETKTAICAPTASQTQ